MKKSISISALNSMSKSLQDERLAGLITSTRRMPNGEMEALHRTIANFESEFEMTSEAMQVAVSDGEMPESEAVCSWLMAIRMRDRLGRLASRSG